jgi:hypothetical protein
LPKEELDPAVLQLLKVGTFYRWTLN